MPRWNNNPVDVSLGIQILDPGFYRFKIEDVKPFANNLKQGQTEQTGGVRAICKVLQAPDQKDVGKTYIANLYQHNEGGRSFSKGFIVPVYGYKADEAGETQFDASGAKDRDWNVDVDNNTLGDGWTYMKGREVNAELTIKIDPKNPEQKNQNAKYMPI